MLTTSASYNSIIYSGTPFNQYAVVSASNTFLEDRTLNTAKVDWQAIQSNYEDGSTLTKKIVLGMQWKAIGSQLFRMNNRDCISAYAQQAQSDYGSLLLIEYGENSTSTSRSVRQVYISDRPSSMYNIPSNPPPHHYNTTMVPTSFNSETLESYDTAPDPFGWICGGKNTTLPRNSPNDLGGPCQGKKLVRVKNNATNWSPFGKRVSYCLSEPAVQQCRLYGNILLILVVVATNIVQAIILIVVIFQSGSSPLLTIGDALSSFLEVSDNTTRNMCLASSHHFRLLNYEKREWTALLTCWVPKKRHWCSTVRVGRWVSALGL